MVWYQDLGAGATPRAVWMTAGDAVTRIPLARDPNWEPSNPEDLKSGWYEWEKADPVKVAIDGAERARVWAADSRHLTATGKNAYAGGTVWTEYASVMSVPYPTPIEEYDPARHAMRLDYAFRGEGNFKPVPRCRYYLENLPQFLDSPGEYYLVEKGAHAGRLYLRLPGDRDPNQAAVELAERLTLVDIRGLSDIDISGLSFRFQNVKDWYGFTPRNGDPEGEPVCVKLLGACRNIRVANCKFEHVMRAFVAASGGPGIADEIAFTDNDIRDADYGPIQIQNRGGAPPEGNIYRVQILRNRLYDVGKRPPMFDFGHALQSIYVILPEIAGNILDRCWAAGIYVWANKGGAGMDWGGAAHGELTRPLSRTLMHHNKVTNSLLNTNDWGGIEFWQNGPAYIYGNISGAPGGYRHWNHVQAGPDAEKRTHVSARFGFAYYLDGGFKSYVFNNVAWGQSSDLASPLCATSAFHEVVGYMNAIFNNTAFRFAAPFRRQSSLGGHGAYLGNLVMDASEVIFPPRPISPPPKTPTWCARASGATPPRARRTRTT